MSLEALMDTQLPLNRKERFFTGTVFPMIVCQDGFRHFSRFTSLLEGYEEQAADARPATSNIQFFTEYNLKESIYGTARARFPNPPATGDTPDILILLHGREKTLIALEAKMYEVPTIDALREQMVRQAQIVLHYLRETLGIRRVYHCALLPSQQQAHLRDFEYPIITWQDIYDHFAEVNPQDYFLHVLGIALNRYDDLVSRGISFGRNAEKRLRGADIYTSYKQGTLDVNIMGRSRGLYGKALQADLQSGSWYDHWYETSSIPDPPNANWFKIEHFIERIDELRD